MTDLEKSIKQAIREEYENLKQLSPTYGSMEKNINNFCNQLATLDPGVRMFVYEKMKRYLEKDICNVKI